jgi:hypothetical protein
MDLFLLLYLSISNVEKYGYRRIATVYSTGKPRTEELPKDVQQKLAH